MQAILNARECDLVVIDELGPLELAGGGFAVAIDVIKSGRLKNSLAVIRSGLLKELLPRLGDSPILFETAPGNRDRLPAKIANVVTWRVRGYEAQAQVPCDA